MQLRQSPHPAQLDAIFLQEEARRLQKKKIAAPRETELLRLLRDNPKALIEQVSLYQEFMETFFYIRPKGRNMQQFKVNNSQQVLLDAFFVAKKITPYVRVNILKGRQQGMSTLIGAFAIMEMLLHPSTGALIATENKQESGKNLYRMYEFYLQEFQKLMQKYLPEDEQLWHGDITNRFSFGNECYLANDSLFTVTGEASVTSKTLQFIHLSEAAFYHHLDDCLGMMLQTLPKEQGTMSTMFIETTAKMYGNEHHDGWEASCEGKSAFLPLFIPWYIHKPYSHTFVDDEERERFKESLGVSPDDPYGDEVSLLKTDNASAPWRKLWKGLDFSKYGYDQMTLENLKFRRFTIDELKGRINEFNRQYPTTPEDAFLSNSAHVLDMNAIRWYQMNQETPPRASGYLKKLGHTTAELKPQRGGILNIWEHPMPHREYIIGVDVAEGFDSGDFSCAYVVCRLPFKIVARLRGAEGRAVRLDELEEQLNLLGYYYNTAAICVENNGSGEAVTSGLRKLGYPNQTLEDTITLGTSRRYGWRSTQGSGGTRDRGINILQEMVADKMIGIPCEVFLREAHHFHYVNGKAQAARKGDRGGSNVGRYDDCIIALVGALLANAVMKRPKTEHEVREEAQERQRRRESRKAFRRTREYSDYKRFV